MIEQTPELMSGTIVAALAIVMGSIMVTVVTGIALQAWRSVAQTRAKEQSRRELAAYVAEGSITPIDAERILRAGGPKTIRETIGEAINGRRV